MNAANTEIAVKNESTQLSAASTEELKSRLASLLATTADGLRDMAAIVAELETRGEDLSGLRIGIIDHLRRIASGQLLPEVVVKFAGQPRVLKIAISLPISEQKRLAEGGLYDLAVWRGDSIEWRKVDPADTTYPQLTQIFAPDHVRNQSEQISLLETRREKSARVPDRVKRGKVRIDRERGTILLNKTAFQPADIVAALSELGGGFDDDADRDSPVVCKLTDDEHQTLKQRALDGRTSANSLILRALKAAGLI